MEAEEDEEEKIAANLSDDVETLRQTKNGGFNEAPFDEFTPGREINSRGSLQRPEETGHQTLEENSIERHAVTNMNKTHDKAGLMLYEETKSQGGASHILGGTS